MTIGDPDSAGAVAMIRGLFPLVLLLPSCGLAAEGDPPGPEQRAIAFLAREVPRWPRENHCFSCHNNGDAARALYAALRAGYSIEPSALTETTSWLVSPKRWEHNGGDGPFSDKRLARVQFTAALMEAKQVGQVKAGGPLLNAAARLAGDQAIDGSWPLEGENEPGSPATYGRFLATYLARESLRAADADRFRDHIERAGRWLLKQRVETVDDASVVLLVCPTFSALRTSPRIARSLELLRKGQSDEGGWGPFVTSAPEAYDTALALLGLSSLEPSELSRGLIARGRTFLIARQQPDGSWVETTRPPGGESYAQRISTTGWATMALIATRKHSATAGSHPKR
jgi:hypothetical protein